MAARAPLRQAMERLLVLGAVRAGSRLSEVGGVRLHALEAGEGPLTLLLHGAGGGGANWFRVMGPLSQSSRILAPDLPGFGLSGTVEPRAPLGAWVAGLVLAWLEQAGIRRCSVVGTSFGGLVALRLAQRAPERVERLVLVDAAGLGPEVPAVVRLVGVPVLGEWLLRPSRAGIAWVLRRLLIADRTRLGSELEAALVDYLWASARAGDPALTARAYRLFCGRGGQRERLAASELAAIRVPTLVVWGERDRFFPLSQGERAAAAIPGAAFRAIPGVGHSPNWEAPAELCAAMLPFLLGRSDPVP